MLTLLFVIAKLVFGLSWSWWWVVLLVVIDSD